MLLLFFTALVVGAAAPPATFVSVQDLDSTILVDAKYFGTDNFVGRPVDGYGANKCILAQPAAEALAKAHRLLKREGYGLKVFDCYRPQKAVDHFVRWAKDLKDEKTKAKFYPKVAKDKLFELGYIAAQSGHSRGSTVDLTVVKLKDKAELDMGTVFDFFDELTHTDSPKVSVEARANRQILKRAMEKAGFKNYAKEWWHYTLRNESFPSTYFSFAVE